jgi:hypothetical protein
MPSRDYRCSANFGFVSSVFILAAASTSLLANRVEEAAGPTASMGAQGMVELEYQRLNTTHLVDIWRARRASKAPRLTSEGFAAVAFVLLLPAVGSLAQATGGDARSATRVLTSCFSAACGLMLLDFTFEIGLVQFTDWISSWPLLTEMDHAHDGGFGAIQSLEIAYQVARSRTLWLFAMDEAFLSIGWGSAAFLVYTTHGVPGALSKRFAHFSSLASLIAFVSVLAHVARPVMSLWRIATTVGRNMSYSLYIGFLPIWLCWLCVQLRSRSETVRFSSVGEMTSAGGGAGTGAKRGIEMQFGGGDVA